MRKYIISLLIIILSLPLNASAEGLDPKLEFTKEGTPYFIYNDNQPYFDIVPFEEKEPSLDAQKRPAEQGYVLTDPPANIDLPVDAWAFPSQFEKSLLIGELNPYMFTGEDHPKTENFVAVGKQTLTQTLLPFQTLIRRYHDQTGEKIQYRIYPYYKTKEQRFPDGFFIEASGGKLNLNVYLPNVDQQKYIDTKTGKLGKKYNAPKAPTHWVFQKQDEEIDPTPSEKPTIELPSVKPSQWIDPKNIKPNRRESKPSQPEITTRQPEITTRQPEITTRPPATPNRPKEPETTTKLPDPIGGSPDNHQEIPTSEDTTKMPDPIGGSPDNHQEIWVPEDTTNMPDPIGGNPENHQEIQVPED